MHRNEPYEAAQQLSERDGAGACAEAEHSRYREARGPRLCSKRLRLTPSATAILWTLSLKLAMDGAVEWSRTTDLLITNQLLYQLSYNSPG